MIAPTRSDSSDDRPYGASGVPEAVTDGESRLPAAAEGGLPVAGGRRRRGGGAGSSSAQTADGDGSAPPVVPPPSLSEHVCQVLRDDILSGRIAPGDRLTEGAVMERTGVSRTPVREGIRRLEAEGLVITFRGRGTYATYRLSPAEAARIYEVRLVLEPFLTRLACERMTAEALRKIQVALDRFCAATDTSPREAGQLDADFHLAIYEASHSQLMTVLHGYFSRLQIELSERVYHSEVPERFVREHVTIFEALQQGDPDRAAERMRRHVEHSRHALQRGFDGKASA